MNENNYDKLISLLDTEYHWPAPYLFKFIVPQNSAEELRLVLSSLQGKMMEKPSKNGNYISISIKPMMLGTKEVIDVYKSVKQVKGIIIL